jgi:hypothetical protein
MDNKTSNTIAWISLIVSIIALILAWSAYNRTGTDVGTAIENNTREAASSIEETTEEIRETTAQIAARAETIVRLTNIRAKIAANEIDEEQYDSLNEVREDLRNVYAEAQGDVKDAWAEIDADLEMLESQMRNDTAEALLTIEKIIEALRQDALSEES